MREISREYFENDPSVQHVIQFVRHSSEMKNAWNAFVTSSEIEDIVEWMGNHGVNIDKELQKLSDDILNIMPMHLRSSAAENFSIKVYENELMDQIKIDDMNDLINELLTNGDDFAHLYLILKVSRPALEKLFLSEDIHQAVEHLIEHGVDVENLKTLTYDLLRWEQ